MIFSFFDPIQYSAKTVSASAPTLTLTDIFRNYRAYFNRVVVNYRLKTYYISGAPRPEDLSYQLYGNTQYYWLLLMANNIYDPYHGWIQSQEASYKGAIQRYSQVGGEQVLYHINADGEKYWNLVEYPENSNLWYDKGDVDHEYLQYNGALAPIDTYEDAIRQNEAKRSIKIVDPSDVESFISALIKEMEKE